MVVEHHAPGDYLASFWTLNTEATPESPLQNMFSVFVVLPSSLTSPSVSFSFCVAFKDCFGGESMYFSSSEPLQIEFTNFLHQWCLCSMTQILMSYLDIYKQFSMIMSRTVLPAAVLILSVIA